MKIKMKSNFSIRGSYRIKTFHAGTKELLRQTEWIPNLIMLNENRGLYIILSRLIGALTYDLPITQAKIGDDDTPPTINDTDLGNPVVSGIAVAQRQRIADDEIMITFFINDSELPDGDYKEFGIFADDQLFARSLIVPTYSKSTGEDTQIDYTLTAEPTA